MHCEPPLSSEQLDVKLKVKDLQEQCHMLSDKADGDILTLKVFCTSYECMRKYELIGCVAGK